MIISLEDMPEDSIIYYKQVFWNNPTFPESNELFIEIPIIISKHKSFYLSGGFFYVLSISDYLDFSVSGEYAFWYSLQKWIEKVPCYFNLKVVVKKNFTGITEDNEIPVTFDLEQNYPNPFNPTTIINYHLVRSNYVTIKVYDAVGKEITTLVDGEKTTGKYELEFNAGRYKLSSGIYFVKMEVFENNSIIYSSTKKLMLIK